MGMAAALRTAQLRAVMLVLLFLCVRPVWTVPFDRQAAKDDPLFYKHSLVEQAKEKYAVCLVSVPPCQMFSPSAFFFNCSRMGAHQPTFFPQATVMVLTSGRYNFKEVHGVHQVSANSRCSLFIFTRICWQYIRAR